MKITIDCRTKQDDSIEAIVTEGTDLIMHELLIMQDITIVQELIKHGWMPPADALQKLRKNSNLRRNKIGHVCQGCGEMPEEIVICCKSCLESSKKKPAQKSGVRDLINHLSNIITRGES